MSPPSAGGRPVRPIYHYAAPKAHRSDGTSDPLLDPALLVQLDWMPPDPAKTRILATFEAEAFFDRPSVGAQTVTQKLLPLPASTTLQQHVWDAASATYFRHRFTLRSRYSGALANVRDRAHRSDGTSDPLLDPALLVQLDRMPPDPAKTRILATFEVEAFFDSTERRCTDRNAEAAATAGEHHASAACMGRRIGNLFPSSFHVALALFRRALANVRDREVKAWITKQENLPTLRTPGRCGSPCSPNSPGLPQGGGLPSLAR